MQYTVTTKRGKVYSVECNLTDDQAQEVLALHAKDGDDFAHSLATKRKLSPKMRAWLHVKAQWLLNPREEAATESYPTILGMLTAAREAGKKFPKIKLDWHGQRVVLALSGAGKVNVTDGGPFHGGTWFGAIQPSGAWRNGRETERIAGALEALEADPVAVASQHGVATGECCFCARELTTKESRSVGYGPVCADRFGLPWGKVDPDLDEKGMEIPELAN